MIMRLQGLSSVMYGKNVKYEGQHLHLPLPSYWPLFFIFSVNNMPSSLLSMRGGGVPHNGLPIQGGSTHKGVSFSEPQEYERVEISLAEVFKRVGKYVISMICKTT